MPVQRIRLLGDPILREISARVLNTASAQPVITDLRDTLHEFQRTHGFGRGISAVQIGQPVRVIYIEFESKPYSLINPEFAHLSPDTFELWDDCFSFPDLLVRLKRSLSLRLHYTDETGAAQTLEASGPLSELIQHEMDHLDGILAVDRAIDRNSLKLRGA
ncbi:MAG: peptide deformylase [Acidobacteria bacterium]|nr:peptide deformylase [Acidobacteriota bacterium]